MLKPQCLLLFCILLSASCFASAHNAAEKNAEKIELISRVKTSIVGIGVYNPLSAPRYQLLGTGFAVQSTSSNITYIATNHHVVNGPSYSPDKAEISVHVGEGKNAKFYRAKLIKQDERSDVAIISIEAELPTLNLANDNQTVRAGTDILIAGLPIGSVLGLYKSVHRGMVAAYVPMAIPQNNSSQLSIELIRQLRNPLFVYQLDATAYPGNSGSPIVNSHTGEVIAILNSVLVKKTKEHLLSDPSGISYAIPAQYIRALLP